MTEPERIPNLREYLGNSIAEITDMRSPDDQFWVGYRQALMDLAKDFFPNSPELWNGP